MPQKSGKLTERERQIGKRLMELRRMSDLSQSKFAKQAGLTHDQLASVEYGRTPLHYEIAYRIWKAFGFSSLWLATNRGVPLAHTPMPSPISLGIPKSALFSEIFDMFLEVFFRQPDSIGKANSDIWTGLHDRATIAESLDESIENWLLELPDEALQVFAESLRQSMNNAGAECGSDNWYSILERKQRIQQYLEMRAFSPIGERKKNAFRAFVKEIGLTEASNENRSAEVKLLLPNLRERLNTVTTAPGKKSELAKFLGAPLASVSRWLSGDREPGGEVTLKMLHWVELQERK